MPRARTCRATVALAMLAAAAAPAAAQDPVAQFYSGKTVTVVIGSTAAGGIDAFGRLIARHIGRHIPGAPNVVPQNMPGAGSITAAQHMYSAAPKDGTQLGHVLPGALVDALLTEGPRRYDATRFSYVGNMTTETHACVARKDAPARTFAETLETEIIIGGTGPGSAIAINPVFLRNMFGAKLRLITGYPGSREVVLAIEKGEVHGICGFNWTSAKMAFRTLFEPDSQFRVLLHEGIAEHPEFVRLGAPRVTEFARTDDDRQVLELFYSTGVINRVLFAPPDIPWERLAALRKAFMAAMADPVLNEEATRIGLEIRPSTGEEVERMVANLYGARQSVVGRIRKLLAGN